MNIHDTLQKADTAFNKWKKVSFEKRQQLFGKLAEVLEAHKEEMAKIITSEMNKPMAQAVAEIEKCALMTRYYAAAPNVLAPEQIETEFRLSEIRYVPKGVILGVMPWNFPFWQALRFAVPAILAGNTVVLKHASICFGTGNRIEKAFLEAGFPEGIFQNIEIGHKEVKEVLENPIVQGVSLTGSEKAGAEVASTAGQNSAPTSRPTLTTKQPRLPGWLEKTWQMNWKNNTVKRLITVRKSSCHWKEFQIWSLNRG